MALTMTIKRTAAVPSRVTADRLTRAVGINQPTRMAPRPRTSVRPQALYLSPYNRVTVRPKLFYRAPQSAFGLASRLASEWLRETTSCVHPVDIQTFEDRYELQSDCPGMGEEDVKVEISPERVLSISGTRKTTSKPSSAPAAASTATAPADAEPSSESPTAADTSASSSSSSAPTPSSASPSSVSSQPADFAVSYRFSRSFKLPEDAEVEEVEAALEKGVLTVRIPRRVVEKAKPRRVGVKAVGVK
ncbi:hypothetical protein Agub_g3589 [Astrephomene gubernaculifera]|uniref:SHSP domain-containing protein n=1 Tax=Astrephomene gubernaculifera TaxID=47775 RepID=A0AAD3HJ32_9CHLO|nr:hypothetical protein Agub_g3589 [Astrephomene gubernaculifera]